MGKIEDVNDQRRQLMVECGLDAFHNTPEVWLKIAVAAEARGEKTFQRDCERAMEISNRRWNP